MNKTGRYVYRDGKCVKVSSDVPRIASRIDGAFYPGNPYTEYFNGRDPVTITSKGHKKAEMAARGIVEYAGDESFEKAGTIYSYTGQVNKTRKSKPAVKLPKSMKHLAANMT